ncbi:MAG: helix-turn-helix transcriptional regulator [Hyphomicrobiales bacterium]|nr:helix-turn-helix transcriptional regulator [Hyphomicrobiales bacterium]
MLIRTSADLGAAIRDRRKQLKLDQAAFAKRVGVSRQWVIGIERGRPRAELALVLRAIDVLGIQLDASIAPTPHRPRSARVDIDAIVAKAREPKP